MDEETIRKDFNGYDKIIDGILCRVYRLPYSREVTFLKARYGYITVHLSFCVAVMDNWQEIIMERLSTAEAISAVDVHRTVIHIQYSILFDYTELKHRILTILNIICDEIFGEKECHDEN